MKQGQKQKHGFVEHHYCKEDIIQRKKSKYRRTFTMSVFKCPLAIGIFKFAPSGLGPSLCTSNDIEYLMIPPEFDAKISSEKSDPL